LPAARRLWVFRGAFIPFRACLNFVRRRNK
jgi:hypothetical protein